MRNTAIKQVRALLASPERDFLCFRGKHTRDVECKSNVFVIAWKDEPDQFRIRDARRLGDDLPLCWCDPGGSESPLLSYGKTSAIDCDYKAGKCNLVSNECGPEPTSQHLQDLLEFVHELQGTQSLTVMNLPGSGAGLPQHFHAHTFPLMITDRPGRIHDLLGNLSQAEETKSIRLQSGHAVAVREILSPLWGVEFQFDEGWRPAQIGTVLFAAIHHGIRYRSQLKYSYNLYLHSESPFIVTILFRDSELEAPFGERTVLDLLSSEQLIEPSDVDQLLRSPNSRWKWGWLECLGGLPSSDDLFADHKYDMAFWGRVYKLLTIGAANRRTILDRVTLALTEIDLLERTV